MPGRIDTNKPAHLVGGIVVFMILTKIFGWILALPIMFAIILVLN